MIDKQWILDNIKEPYPKLVVEALKHYGIKEIPGKAQNNPLIMSWAQEFNLSKEVYPNDETAWCALFMCKVCKDAGKPMPFKYYAVVRARSFAAWGNMIPIKDARFGTVLVFRRPGGDHVGLYVAETETHFYVLGGNQKNGVNIMPLEKERCTNAREFYVTGPPESAKKYFVENLDEVSTNEA